MALHDVAMILAAPILFFAITLVALQTNGSLPGVRIVPHQHVGIYIRHGSLLQVLEDPGLHIYWPLLTSIHDVFLGLEHDVVPPWGTDPYGCRSTDGSYFKLRVDVLNRLNRSSALDTLNRFGLTYDRTTIYDQVAPALKKVCSKLSAFDIAIGKFDEVDDQIGDEMRDAQKNILNSSVDIVQLKILELIVPDDLSKQFAAMAALKAEQLTYIEKRKLDEENITNQRLLHEAALAREIWEAEVRKNLTIMHAQGQAEARKIEAEAKRIEKESEAEADKSWLSNSARSRIEQARLNPLGSLIGQISSAIWPPGKEVQA